MSPTDATGGLAGQQCGWTPPGRLAQVKSLRAPVFLTTGGPGFLVSTGVFTPCK